MRFFLSISSICLTATTHPLLTKRKPASSCVSISFNSKAGCNHSVFRIDHYFTVYGVGFDTDNLLCRDPVVPTSVKDNDSEMLLNAASTFRLTLLSRNPPDLLLYSPPHPLLPQIHGMPDQIWMLEKNKVKLFMLSFQSPYQFKSIHSGFSQLSIHKKEEQIFQVILCIHKSVLWTFPYRNNLDIYPCYIDIFLNVN